MNHDQVQAWLDDYISAWRSGDADAIGALFTEDAVYAYRPWDSEETTVRGRDAIVASWLANPDDPEGWEASYGPFAVDGDRAVSVGWSRYLPEGDDPEKLYHNVYLLRFADGACAEFREFFVRERR